ncbi:MAG: ATP-binding protein [bacterium]|nr:ATP-binding protein [bacterium]
MSIVIVCAAIVVYSLWRLSTAKKHLKQKEDEMRHQMQQVIRTEQAKMDAVVESMHDGVVMIDASYKVVVMNPAARKIVGNLPQEQVTISHFIEKFGSVVDIRNRLDESLTQQKSFESDRVQVRDQYFEIFIFPVFNTDPTSGKSKVVGGALIMHNVTHEMELQRVRQDFTSMVVHELRAPLGAIHKMSEVLQQPVSRKKDDIENRKEYVHMIHQNASEMLELISDILDAAKIEAGKFEITPLPSDMAEVIHNRIQFFNATAHDAHIEFNPVIDPHLPKHAIFDPESFKQVLNNLITNAIKFSQPGGTITIAAFTHQAGDSIEFEIEKMHIKLPTLLPNETFAHLGTSLVGIVIDSGQGISREHIGSLFQKFKQLKPKGVSPHKGTGLGLAIAKGIVETHQGVIGAVSEPGVGSAFYFVIPLKESQQ